MKRLMAIVLAAVLLLGLAACGGGGKNADLSGVYESMEATLPDMILADETLMLNMFGIKAEDCEQVVVAFCGDGLKADEVWLIEAKDTDALERIQGLAENRVKAKAAETEFYLPDQYAVVQEGEIITQGNYLALLVSPDVDTLKGLFEKAVK